MKYSIKNFRQDFHDDKTCLAFIFKNLRCKMKNWTPEQPKNKSTKELLDLIFRSLDDESGMIGDLTFDNAIFVDDWLTKRGFDSRIENETDNFGGDLQRPNHKCVYFKKHNCDCRKGKQ